MPYSMSMDLLPKQTQNLKQTQRLIMSPQMQQAIHLLQMPILELSTTIDAELEQNPVLEYMEEEQDDPSDLNPNEQEIPQEGETSPEKELVFDDRDFEILRKLDDEFRDCFAESGTFNCTRTLEEEKRRTFLESSICDEASLFEHLMKQAKETFETPEDLAMAEALIGNFSKEGFLETSLDEIALCNNFNEQRLKHVLKDIQSFEPYGVGARNLQESLLIQLRCQQKKETLAYSIIDEHYDDLLHNRIPVIRKALACTSKEIEEALNRHITKLDLHPGTWFSRTLVPYITADVSIKQEGDRLFAAVNDEPLPSLRLNSKYLRMLEDESLPSETKDFIRNKILSAKWLLRNIWQRSETLEKIAQSLAKRQKEFFLDPHGKLVPLTMKMVAEELGLHESTIARAVANKYVDSPKGLLPLRSFFTNAFTSQEGEEISAKTVREVLLDIIQNEDKHKPLSDQAISQKIKEMGISCARRTVAKFRAALNIGNAQQRRKF